MTVTKATYSTSGKITFVVKVIGPLNIGVIFITQPPGATTPVSGYIDTANPAKAFLQVNAAEFAYLKGFVTQPSQFTVELGYESVGLEVIEMSCCTSLIHVANQATVNAIAQAILPKAAE